MDILKTLILIVNKEGIAEDKTAQIISIRFDNLKKIWNITYLNNRTYPYRKDDVFILDDPKEIDIKDSQVYVKGKYIHNPQHIIEFGPFFKIISYTGKTYVHRHKFVKIVKNQRADKNVNNIISYLSAVSEIVKPDEDEEGFLHKEITSLFINEESVLSSILQNKEPEHNASPDIIISPWQANESQMQAVNSALTSRISVIQGPPGTGKTQTILNIIANLLLQNKTIAIAAGNNEAVKNIIEKLKDESLDSICAPLGSNSNVEDFMENQKSIEYLKTQLADDTLIMPAEIKEKAKNIEKYFRIQSEIGSLYKELYELSAEKRVSDYTYEKIVNAVPEKLLSQRKIANPLASAAYIETLGMKARISFADRLRLRFTYKIKDTRNVLKNISSSTFYLQHYFYDMRKTEIEKRLEKLKTEAASLDISESSLSDFRKISMCLLRRHLQKHYEGTEDRKFTFSDYKQNFHVFTERYPVVFSTTHSLHHCTDNAFLYDYLIIDEASQVDLCSAVAAMSCARNLICVGDSKQLPHVVRTKDQRIIKPLTSTFDIPETYDYCSHSLLSFIVEKYGNSIPSTLLKEHFRCDPDIIGFCNKRFYNDELVIRTEHKEGNGVKVFKTLSHSERERTNERQCKSIRDEILPETGIKDTGIVTPYRAQADLLKQWLPYNELLIDTVHKFQGKERSSIILSTVSDHVRVYEDADQTDFLNNPNLINVAISRAKNRLYVVASEELLNQNGTLINDFIRYLNYYSSDYEIKDSKVYSVFDIMYDRYSPILETFKKKMLRISDFDSENIMASILRELQNDDDLHPFGFAMHYPLSKIVNPSSLADKEDARFASNSNTHLDFLIYDVLDKSPVLAVEVDGLQHVLDKRQSERDKRKDRLLLQQAGVRIVRIPTTSVDCKEKVKNAISNAFSG